jgi:hypothetical protein
MLLAVGRLRECWHVLASASTLDHAGPVGRDEYAVTPERTARRLARWVADRDAAWLAIRDRTKPTGAVPAPLSARLLDARTLIAEDVYAIAREAWEATYARRVTWVGPDVDTRVKVSLTSLGRCARDGLSPVLGVVLVDELDGLADRVAGLCGLGEFFGHMPVPCLACGWRGLHLHSESPHESEWVTECARAECRCTGDGCGCGMGVRVGGRRHVWQRSEWDRAETPTPLLSSRQ